MTELMSEPAQGRSGVAGAPLDPVTVRPGDPRYPDLSVRHANGRWKSTPDRFVLASSTEQVVQAVSEAVRAGQRLAVRSSGHCYEDFVNDGARVMIDLAELNAVHYDERRAAFLVEAGATLLDVYRRLFFVWGVTIPGGSCGGVAAGGHVAGGGYGPLSRQFGLTVDYLHAVEVVVVGADGTARAVVATRDPADPNHDLWWAHTGGGGGNFGVVTRYWFRAPAASGTAPARLLPNPPATILSSQVLWSWADLDKQSFLRLVRNHGQWHERNNAPDSPYAGLYAGLVLLGREPGQDPGPACISFSQIDGTTQAAHALLADYVATVTKDVPAPAVIRPFTESPWLALTVQQSRLLDTQRQRLKLKAADLKRHYPDERISTLHDWLAVAYPGRGQVSVSFQSFGGRVSAVAPDATAAVHRDSILKVLFYSTWERPETDAGALDWMRRFYRAVYAATGGVPVPGEVDNGVFINFPDNDIADPVWNTSGVPWHELYYRGNYPRLQRIKAEWDPRDVFWHTLSIRPAP